MIRRFFSGEGMAVVFGVLGGVMSEGGGYNEVSMDDEKSLK